MPRGLSSEIQAAIAADMVRPVYLVYIDFVGYIFRTWSGEGNLSYDSHAWSGNGHLQALPDIPESGSLVAQPLKLQLTGKPDTAVDLSDPDVYQGRSCQVYVGFLDSDGLLAVNRVYQAFSGTVSQVSFSSDARLESWTVTVESRLVDLQRVKSARWTHEEQRSRYPSDNGFLYAGRARTALAIFRDVDIPPPGSRKIVYGQRRVTPEIVFAATSGTGSRYLNLVCAIADHECEEIVQLYLDDRAVLSSGVVAGDFVGFVDYYERLGADAQTYIAELETEVGASIWDLNCRLRGVAYVYLRLLSSEELFGDAVPLVDVEVKGKKLYDPRTTTTAYSTNPALAVRDYLLATSGFGAAAGEIDEPSIEMAADVCDTVVSTIAGSEAKYGINGVIDSASRIGDNLQLLLNTFFGKLVYAGGKFTLTAGAWTAPVVTITESDLIDAIGLQTQSRRELSNGAKGIYANPDQDWSEEDYPAYSNAAALSADGESRFLVLNLPLTTSASAAQRLAKIAVNDSRRTRSLSLLCKASVMDLISGDIVNLSLARLGFSGETYRIEQMRFEPVGLVFGVRLELLRMDSDFYDWNEATEELAPETYTDPDAVFYTWANAAQAALPSPGGTPGNQSFSADFNVTVSHNTAGVNCHYTTDGSEPSQSSPTVADGGTVTIVHANADVVLKLKNYDSGGSGLRSATVEYIYTATLVSDAPVGVLRSSAVYNGSGQVSNAYALLVFSAPQTTLDGSEITLEARNTNSGSTETAWDNAHISFEVSANHSDFSTFWASGGAYSKYEARTSATGHTTTTVTMPRQFFPPLAFIVNDSGDGFDKVVVGVWERGTVDAIEVRWRTRPDIPESGWREWKPWQDADWASNGFGHDLRDGDVNFIESAGIHTGSGTSGLRLLIDDEVYEYQIRMKPYSPQSILASDVVTVTGSGSDPGEGSSI